MRGSIVLVVLLALMLLVGSQVTASSSTPPAHEPAATPVVQIGVTRIGIARGTPVAASGAETPQHLWLERVTLLPGADSGTGLRSGARVSIVEQGNVELTVQDGAVSLTCANLCDSAQGTPAAAGVAPLNVPIVLQTGDRATQYDATTYSLRNTGTETAVVLIEGLGPALWRLGLGCGGGCF